MNNIEFEKFIESIGFKYNGHYYRYKDYIIFLNSDNYEFNNGSEWVLCIEFYDLTPLKNELKNEFRSLKLKQILK